MNPRMDHRQITAMFTLGKQANVENTINPASQSLFKEVGERAAVGC